MKSLQSFVALFGVVLAVAQLAPAQSSFVRGPQPPTPNQWLYPITRNYRERPITGISMRNSGRLEQLVRAGKLYLSLQDAIALALENNIDIEIQRYGPELAKIDLNRAEAGGLIRGVQQTVFQGAQSATNFLTGGGQAGGGSGGAGGGAGGTALSGTVFQVTGTNIPSLDPVFSMGYSNSKSSQPQINSFITGTTAVVTSVNSWNAQIQKQFLTGTGVTLAYDTSGIETNQLTADLNPFNRGTLSLQVSQRLLQGFGLQVNNRNIRIARNSLRVSDLTFKQQVITTVASVINLYWDLVSFNEAVKVRRQALTLAQKLYEDNKKQVEIGTLAPIEIVRAEAEVARNQQDLTIAETQVLQQETILKNQLSRNGVANDTLAAVSIVPTDRISIPENEAVLPANDLIDQALKQRPELEQTRLNITNTKIGLAGARSALLPSLDIFGSTGTRALSGSVNPVSFGNQPRNANPFFVGGFTNALGQLFRRNFPDYTLGVQLNVPLRNRAAQADIANDTLRLRQQELQEQRQLNSIRVDVQNALIALQQARAQYQSAMKNRDLQQQTLDAEQKKYALGSSTIFLVIQGQRDLALAQQSEVQAQTAYARARNQMYVAAGNLLDTYQISLDDAIKGEVARPVSVLPPPGN
jgi:outer membrane protein TolC